MDKNLKNITNGISFKLPHNDQADDFYVFGEYYEPPREPGATCEAADQCSGFATCDDGACACGEGAVEGFGEVDGEIGTTCVCDDGFVPDATETACIDDPCDPDPCSDGERCSVDQGSAVCTPSLARVGEHCNDNTNPCEPGLRCEFIPCPYAAGGRMCVTPCGTASECAEANIACPKRNATQQPICESTSTSSPAYCTWDG